MKKFFNTEDREKEKGKIIELSFGINFEEIKDYFEDVDPNGEEIEENKNEDKDKVKGKDSENKENEAGVKKKKKNKKK
jgi:hypothetical protein